MVSEATEEAVAAAVSVAAPVAVTMARRMVLARRLIVVGNLAAASACAAMFVQGFLHLPDPGQGWLRGVLTVVPGICLGLPALVGGAWLGFTAWAWTLDQPRPERIGFVAAGLAATLLLGGLTMLIAVP